MAKAAGHIVPTGRFLIIKVSEIGKELVHRRGVIYSAYSRRGDNTSSASGVKRDCATSDNNSANALSTPKQDPQAKRARVVEIIGRTVPPPSAEVT